MSFPPDSFYNQDEFHACLDAIGAKLVRLNVGDSKIVTDITGAPAGLHQPDGTARTHRNTRTHDTHSSEMFLFYVLVVF